MNGAAAHLIKKGDEIIIMGFELTERPIESKQIVLGEHNEFVRWLAVTDVVLLRARPAHVVNAALFPGARLQMPPGTVKSRTFYGWRALRRVLAAHDAVA